MDPVKKMLVPTDFSPTAENAFRYALQLADNLDATIDLVHAVFPEYEAMDLPVLSAHGTKLRIEAAKSNMEIFIEKGITQLQTAGLLVDAPIIQSHVDIGSAVSVICKYAEDDTCDMILMGTQGEHNTIEKFLGTVSTGVIKHSSVPVLVVPEDCDFTKIRHMAYASQLSNADPYHIWAAMILLAAKDPELSLVHVEPKAGEELVEKMREMETFFDKNRSSLKVKFTSLEGDNFPELMTRYITDEKPDILVMFREKRNFFENLLHHSKTREMALWTQVPLLVLKD